MRIILSVVALALASCGDADSEVDQTSEPVIAAPAKSDDQEVSGSSSAADPIASCVARGVAYFKEIGSYPTLSSAPNAGRSAEDVAVERCNRTTTAF